MADLTTAELAAIDAEQEQYLAEQAALDERMARQGKQRVACTHCDSEHYVPVDRVAPYYCGSFPGCSRGDWYGEVRRG